MIHSTELAELAAARSAAQGQFEAVAKDATNPFFKSKYADLPAVVKAASPILKEHGLAVAQFLGHDEYGDTLTTVLLHKSGQFIGDTMQLRPVKDDPQAQGSATSYGRRYAYMAALGLVADEDDDGNAASAGQRQQRKPAAKPKPKTTAPPVDKILADDPPKGDAEFLAKLRDLNKSAGWSADKMQWKLVELGVEIAEGEALGDAMKRLTLDQAQALAVALGGTLLPDTDDDIPGSGATS